VGVTLVEHLWLALGLVLGLVLGWVWAEAPLKRQVRGLALDLAEAQGSQALALVLEGLLEQAVTRVSELEKELGLARAQVEARQQDLVLAQARLLVLVGEQGRESLKIREME
jgi:uncharacterized protein HemX